MDRNKVLELARKAELARQFALEVPFVVDRLERFVALIEREVRGDAELSALRFQDNNGAMRKTPEDCQRFGANGVPAAIWFGERRYLPEELNPAPAVTEDAVAYIGTDGNLGWLKKPEALYSKAVPLFSHPAPAVAKTAFVHLPQDPDRFIALQSGDRLTVEARNPAPAVVRQLVEALETLVGWEEAEAAHFEAEGPDDWIMDKARRALAAVKEEGL